MTIGTGLRHPEWEARTSGAIDYTRDIALDDMLIGKILRSPHAHARIMEIDTTAAKRIDGVVAVLTSADLPDRNYLDYGQKDRHALADGIVRYFGQEVSIVAAESTAQADRAIDAIRVQYRVLRPVTDAIAALQHSAPAVHPDRGPTNVATSMSRRFGDLEAAKLRTAHRTKAEYHYGIQAHACMEPHSVLASWDAENEVMNLWAPTQAARNHQLEVAHMLGLELDQVRLHRVAVGGDFGSRVRATDIEVLAATLSRQTARPVQIALSRADEFAHNKHQHGSRIELETGLDENNILTYRAARVTVENGAYIHGGSNMMSYCGILIGAQYRLEGAEIEGQSVYTHRRPGGSFRGAGGPQAVFAIESQMDELADELGLDPIDLRLGSVNQPGDQTITGWEIGSCGVVACIEAVRERLNWDEARKLTGSGRGIGIAIAMHCSGAIVSPGTSRAEAVIEIGHNSGVSLVSGSSDPGTGESTVIAQICAEELGIDPGTIDLRLMDTATTPYDPGGGASRATHLTGSAVLAASQAMAETLREVAAGEFGIDASEVTLEDGFAVAGDRRLSFGELAAAHPDGVNGLLRVEREHVAEIPIVPMTADASGFGNLSPSYCYAAHGVEVEVDYETGAVTVIRVVAAHDSGTIINPVGARGQVIGGVVMGIGAALGEQLLSDAGRPINASYVDYGLPRAAQAPPVEVIFVGDESPRGPYGAKSIAEIALMPTAAAVANAVAHAVGVRVRELPISPDMIQRGLRLRSRGISASPLWHRPDRWWAATVRWFYPRGLRAILHRWGTRFAKGNPAPRSIESVLRPTDSNTAIAALATAPNACAIGGATDVLVMLEQGLASPTTLVDLTSCDDLTTLATNKPGDLVIGAAVTLADIARHLRPTQLAGDNALAATIDSIASTQIRETATLAGNLCQANRCWFYRGGFACFKRGGNTCPCYAVTGDHRYYHAIVDAGRCQAITPSDLATTLTALDATLRLKSASRGEHTVTMAEFYVGPGETVLQNDEIVTAVTIPAVARNRAAHFEKLALVEGGFAVVSACVSAAADENGNVLDCRIVLGGVANTPYRAHAAERRLASGPPSDNAIAAASQAWAKAAHPLMGNAWKVDAACGVLRRTIVRVLAA